MDSNKEFKLAVIGSRDILNKEFIYSELDKLLELTKIDLIVSGGAPGPDKIGVEWAKERNIPYKEYFANWKDMSEPCVVKYNAFGAYNALAGFKRNEDIINNCDSVVAFWDGKSKGTKNSLDLARKQNKPIKIIKHE